MYKIMWILIFLLLLLFILITKEQFQQPDLPEDREFLNFLKQKYKIINKIQSTAYSHTYKALKDNQTIVIKIQIHETKKETKMYETEIKILQKLKNIDNTPNIIDHGLYKNRYYIVLEYISGQKFYNHIENKKNLTPIFMKLMNIVKKVHDLNIYNVDIKSDNIIIDKNDNMYLIDYGSSCLEDICDRNNILFPYLDFDHNNPTEKNIKQNDIWKVGVLLAKILIKRNIIYEIPQETHISELMKKYNLI